MYLNHEHRLVFLAQPKTASKAVAVALNEFGFVNINGSPANGQSKFPHHMRMAEAQLDSREWTTFSVVRNHWDAIVSWICCNYGDASVAHENWTADFVHERLRPDDWIGECTLWHRHLADSDHVFRYESLHRELKEFLARYGMDLTLLPVVVPTPQRAARPYQVFYSPGAREYVAERFKREIVGLGYSFGQR